MQYYQHDLRAESEIFPRHIQVGSLAMVWAAVSWCGRIDLVEIDGTIESQYYCNVLQSSLIFNADRLFGKLDIYARQCIFPYVFLNSCWLEENIVDVLIWPARSLEINIIETVWSCMARLVYEEGIQFEDVNTLQEAIMAAWEKLTTTYIRKLYRSLPDRLISVLKRRGKLGKY